MQRLIVTVLVLMALLMAACSSEESTSSAPAEESASSEGAADNPAPSGKPIRLALLPVTDVIPFYVAADSGFFDEEGVQVELIPVSSAVERDTLIQTGEVDGQLSDLVSTVLTNANGGDELQIKVVRQGRVPFPEVPQFYIVSAAESGITDLEGLKGEEIGISENSVIEYITDRLLQLEGFTDEEIVTTNVPQIPTRYQLLSENQLSAAVLPDPLASLALLQGAHLILGDSTHPEVSQSVISFRTDVLESQAGDVAGVLRAYDKAVKAINASPAAYQNALITNSRVPEPLLDKYQLPPFPEGTITSEAQFADVVRWALEKGLIEQQLTYDQLVDERFME